MAVNKAKYKKISTHLGLLKTQRKATSPFKEGQFIPYVLLSLFIRK